MSGLKIAATTRDKTQDPSTLQSASGAVNPIRHTQHPIVTGASVIALRCKDGIILAADTLASYGSLARFRSESRLHAATPQCVLAVGGDMSDYEELRRYVDQAVAREICHDDGHGLSPRAIHQYLARIMYNRRNKMDPLWNSVIVAGMQEGKPMLGLVDLVGTHFESEVIATGYAEDLGLPILRKAYREDITVEEGRKVITDVMKILFYRHARAIDRIQIATVTDKGVDICDPFKLQTKWDYKAFISGARGGDASTW